MWYSIAADCIYTLTLFLVPCFFLHTPRHGSRMRSYALITICFEAYSILFRYVWLPPNDDYYLVGVWVVMAILYLWLFELRGKWYFISLAGLWLYGILSDMIASVFLITLEPTYLERYQTAEFGVELSNMGRLMSVLICGVTMTVFALVYLCLIRRKQKRIFFGFLCVPIYHLFLVVGYFLLCADWSNKVANIGLAMAVFNFFLDVFLLYALSTLFRKQDMETEIDKLEEKSRMEQQIYAADSQYMEEIRLMRHDFANQLQVVYGAMEDAENIEQVRQLLNEMREQIRETDAGNDPAE